MSSLCTCSVSAVRVTLRAEPVFDFHHVCGENRIESNRIVGTESTTGNRRTYPVRTLTEQVYILTEDFSAFPIRQLLQNLFLS
jgi:hypothetical protein